MPRDQRLIQSFLGYSRLKNIRFFCQILTLYIKAWKKILVYHGFRATVL
uniref:Uncharacterized protein n=1 Tax=Arundo donax TaxID=35708 RepID=A0A0A9HLI3_ARUDO